MVDSLSPKERSERMSRIKSKHSAPEMKLRSLIHRMGFRYRLHVKNLPGKPDLVFPAKHAIIFMHGCFWHRHSDCKLARLPKSRIPFWSDKLEANKARDQVHHQQLIQLGWRVLVVWECQLTNTASVAKMVQEFLLETRRCENEIN